MKSWVAHTMTKGHTGLEVPTCVVVGPFLLELLCVFRLV